MKKETFRRIFGGISLALGIFSIFAFLLLPMFVFRPESFGVEDYFEKESSGSTLDLWKESAKAQKTLDEDVEEQMKELEELVELFPDEMEDSYHVYADLLWTISKLPFLFSCYMIVSVLGLAVAAFFGATNLFAVRRKWGSPRGIFVGGMTYLLAGALLIAFVAKILYDVLNTAGALGLFGEMGWETFFGNQKITLGNALSFVCKVVGPGLYLPFFVSVSHVLIGLLLPDASASERVLSRPYFDNTRGQGDGMRDPNATIPQFAAGKVVVLSGEYQGCEIALKEGEKVTMGTNPHACQLVFSGNKLAPMHCSITCVLQTDRTGNTHVQYELQTYVADGFRFRGITRPLLENECVTVEAGTEVVLCDRTSRFRLA